MFTCFQCGECCKDVVFYVEEKRIALHHANYRGVDPRIIARFRDALKFVDIKEFDQREHYMLKGKCPFFCKAEGCMIYLSRPFACRNFMCGRKDKKEVLEWKERTCMTQMKRICVDPGYKEYVEKELEKSMAYASAIGIL